MRTGTGSLAIAGTVAIRQLTFPDLDPLVAILLETDVFTSDEVQVARDLMEFSLRDPEQGDYLLHTAVEAGEVLGYSCIGPTPLTRGTFDLYWIAVKSSRQGTGIGRLILNHAEGIVRSGGGRLLVAETSSQPKYDATRQFYVNCGYSEVARIRDYYKPQDDLVVYGKYFSQ